MSHPSERPALTLGVPGFTFADLHVPERLRDLHGVFLYEVSGADPELGRQWDEYSKDPDASRPGPEVSQLHVRMASHVSRFVARLFGVEDEWRAMEAATRAQGCGSWRYNVVRTASAGQQIFIRLRSAPGRRFPRAASASRGRCIIARPGNPGIRP